MMMRIRNRFNSRKAVKVKRMPWHWEPKKDVISCEKLR